MAPFLNPLSIFFMLSLSLLGAIVALEDLVEGETLYQGETLYEGETLKADEFLENGKYKFIMQTDCNLVLFRRNEILWSSNTSRLDGPCSLMLQFNGSMVISNGMHDIIWCSCTTSLWKYHNMYYLLTVQTDGNVVIYHQPSATTRNWAIAIWSTNTSNIS